MNTLKNHHWLFALGLLLGGTLFGAWGVQALTRITAPAALGSGFSYQGRLSGPGGAVTDTCTLTFSLFDADSGGSQIGNDHVIAGVAVIDGLFTVTLNDADQFGPNAFDGQPRWLEIAVQCTGDGSPTVLSRQPINPVPYALFAERFAGYQNVIVVAKSNGDFDSVADAVNAIGVDPRYPASSASNRYLIYIAPGVYDDARVILKPYVDLEGAGQGLTFINYPAGTGSLNADSAVLVGAESSEVRHLTVNNTNVTTTAWVLGIYNNQPDFRLLHVTATSIGGQRSRAIVAQTATGELTADYVTASATGGSLNSIAFDIPEAAFYGSHLTAHVDGGSSGSAALYLNDSSVVRIESLAVTMEGKGTVDYGIFGFSLEDALLDGITINFNNTVGNGYPIFMEASTGVTVRNTHIQAFGEDNAIYGVYYFNSNLTLHNSTITINNTVHTFGVLLNGSAAGDYHVDILDVVIDIAHSNPANATGLWLNTQHADAYINGRVSNTAVKVVAYAGSGINRGVHHISQGEVDYRNLTVNLDAGPTSSLSYGMHIERGTAVLTDANIEALASGTVTVFGLETQATGQVFAERVGVLAHQTNAGDAVGFKINADASTTHIIRQIISVAIGTNFVYGMHLQRGVITASEITVIARDTVHGGNIFGVLVGNGTAGQGNLTLTHADITLIGAQEFVDGPIALALGIYCNNCALSLSRADISVVSEGASNYGVYSLNHISLHIQNTAIDLTGYDGSYTVATGRGIYLFNSDNNMDTRIDTTNIRVVGGLGGTLHGVSSQTSGVAATQVVDINNSYINAPTVISETGSIQIYVNGSTLEGGATVAAPASAVLCTGVTRINAGIYSFVAGPSNCP